MLHVNSVKWGSLLSIYCMELSWTKYSSKKLARDGAVMNYKENVGLRAALQINKLLFFFPSHLCGRGKVLLIQSNNNIGLLAATVFLLR